MVASGPNVIEDQIEKLVESPALLKKFLLQLLPHMLEQNEMPVAGGRHSRSISKRQGSSSRGKVNLSRKLSLSIFCK